jgi:hypothetical protein
VSLSPPILRETERGETDGNHQNDGYPIGHIPSDNIFICHRLASVVCRLTRPELQNAGKYTPDFLAGCRLGGGGVARIRDAASIKKKYVIEKMGDIRGG